MQISTGARIASFEIRARLGAGGMGTVYRAYDTKLGRDVAIKILQEDLAHSPDYLRRFEREARAASALNHPNIITIYEIDEFEGQPFIAMELVEGTRLRDVLKNGPLPVRKLLDLAAQIAEGMAAAHARGIVHRDIKPDNVMLTPQGTVKILDFGLARPVIMADDDSTAEITGDHRPHIVGTAAYMSPEQASGEEVDFRSDQFSFGAVLYEMATGRRAFKRDSTTDTILAIIHDEPEPVREINPNMPVPLCWIIDRCLAKDRNDRYASTTDLVQELRTLRDRLPETSSPSLRSAIGTSRRATVALAFAAMLAVAAGVGSRLINTPSRAPGQKYLAVLPFKDLSGRPDGQLFSQGFADAVSSRLANYTGVQVITPASCAPLVSKGATPERVAQQLGATLVLQASVQRAGDEIRVTYSVLDPVKGVELAGDAVSGPLANIWKIQDELAGRVARDLGIEQRRPPTEIVGLETAAEQDLYLRALGGLDQYGDQKAVDSSIALLRELMETASQSSLVNAALGRAYLTKYAMTRDAQWIEKASAACARARAIDPTSADVLSMTAKLASFTARYDEAIRTYKRSLALQPNSPDATIGLAKTYAAKGQFAAAEQQFRRGIDLRPAWWFSHNELGTFFLHQGRFDDALREYREVIRLDPENALGHLEAGAVYVSKGDLQKGVDAFTKAALLSGDAAAYSNLGYCYFYLGRYDEAADYSRRAVQIQPAVAAYWANLGDACSWTDRCRNEARHAYTKGIELSQKDLDVNANTAMAHAVLARCFSKTGKPAQAREHVRRALEIQPQNPTWMYEAARVANLGSNEAEAVSWLRRALAAGYQQFEVERDPDFAKLRETESYRNIVQKRE